MCIIIALFAISCTKEHNTNTVKLSSINKKYFVKESVAKYVAENFNFFKVPKANSRNTSNLTVKEIININDVNNIPAYYAINYNDDAGYLILSADFRQEAVIGFGEEGNFIIANIPPQLNQIIKDETSEIEYLRENEVDSIEEFPKDSWSMTTLPPDDVPIEVDPENGNCGDAYEYTKGPLLTTTWDQSGTGNGQPASINSRYNDLCPMLSCGRPPVGCVATAMAQIMYYHKKPTSYNWASMANTYSTPACAQLMRNAGMSVDMDYDCSGSGAYSSDVESALENDFGYASSTNYQTYYSGPMQIEIDAYRPVYVSAGGHAWVCDGYRYFFSGCSGTIWPHMNWGWGGFGNNYCAFNNWQPSGSSSTYNSNRKMVIVRK